MQNKLTALIQGSLNKTAGKQNYTRIHDNPKLKAIPKKQPVIRYPKNEAVNKFIENVFDRFLTDSMPDVVKESTQKLAAYMDFSLGYWIDYENHVKEAMNQISPEIIEAMSGGKYSGWPPEIQSKTMKRVQAELALRLNQMKMMRALYEQQQQIMKLYSEDQAIAFAQLQEILEQ